MLSRIQTLLIWLFLFTLAEAKELVFPGISKGPSPWAVSDAASAQVKTAAATLLSRYFVIKNGHWFHLRAPADSNQWSETVILSIERVVNRPISEEDSAKGITHKYFATVDSNMYRNFDAKTERWGPWRPKPNPDISLIICVDRHVDGRWIASSKLLDHLVPLNPQGDPNLILNPRKTPAAKTGNGSGGKL